MVFDSVDILVPHFITPRHVQLGLLVSDDVEIVILVHIPDTLPSTLFLKILIKLLFRSVRVPQHIAKLVLSFFTSTTGTNAPCNKVKTQRAICVKTHYKILLKSRSDCCVTFYI